MMGDLNDDRYGCVYIARQPILDQSQKVFGYELLYRASAADTACLTTGDLEAARVLTDAALTLGLDTLTSGRPAFLNFTRNLLLNCAGTLLPPPAIVLEVLEDVTVDRDLTEACRTLHGLGYALALDDFVPGSAAETLLPYVKFVKVDVLATLPPARAELAGRLRARGLRLVAEKVETAETAREVRAEGYDLVQGYFFCKPATLQSRSLPAKHLAYLELLAALNRPEVTVGQVEELIRHDASLSYRVLRCINSAACSIGCKIGSIRQAVVLLGVDHIRKWASVWAVAGINTTGTEELATMALLRARCCELLGDRVSPDQGSRFFLLGLCSLLDVMLDQPMEKAIGQLPLPEEIRQALLGQSNAARSVLDGVIAYERGAWDEANAAVSGTGCTSGELWTAYGDALRWAQQLTQETAAAA